MRYSWELNMLKAHHIHLWNEHMRGPAKHGSVGQVKELGGHWREFKQRSTMVLDHFSNTIKDIYMY